MALSLEVLQEGPAAAEMVVNVARGQPALLLEDLGVLLE
jgi:hypothetical protein